MIHMPDEPVTVERVVDGQLRVLGHDKARVEAEPSRCDACDCAGARESSSLRGEWSRPSRGRPRRSRPRAACARVCGSGSEPARPKIDARRPPRTSCRAAWSMASSGGYAGQGRDARRRGRELRGRCSRPSSCCLGPSYRSRSDARHERIALLGRVRRRLHPLSA